MKIQIVDDDVDFAESMAEVLQVEGHETALAHSGEAAITQLQHDSFDLTFMDIRMPGLNGLETYRRMKAINPQSNVYMMTGFAVGQISAQAIEEGVLGIMPKPLDFDAILALIDQFDAGALVLLVDDDPDFVAAVRDVLDDAGHVVMTALTGQQAIAHLGTTGFKAVVLDLRLGEIGGLDVFRYIQQVNDSLPTIIVTAYLDEEGEALDKVRTEQIKAVLPKPLNAEDLIRIIDELNGNARLR